MPHRRAAREGASAMPWAFWAALGLLLVLIWALASKQLPALQQELEKWSRLAKPDIKPT